jgi:hypothetical protein
MDYKKNLSNLTVTQTRGDGYMYKAEVDFFDVVVVTKNGEVCVEDLSKEEVKKVRWELETNSFVQVGEYVFNKDEIVFIKPELTHTEVLVIDDCVQAPDLFEDENERGFKRW